MRPGWLHAPSARDLLVALGSALCAAAVTLVVLGVWTLALHQRASEGTWVCAAAAVALAVPLSRSWVERAAERLLFGRDGDPYAVLSRFVDDVSGAIAVDDVLPQLARAAAAVTHSPAGQATVRLADGALHRQTWPPQVPRTDHEVTVPLERAGRLVGELGVQGGDDDEADDDRQLLQRLSGPAGLALANVSLTLDLRSELAHEQALLRTLQASRQRLLVAAAEQRATFAADVERDVAPALIRAGAALDRVAAGDASGLGVARAHALEALESLRALAARVYQVTLTQQGLVAALDRFVDGRDDVRWSAVSAPQAGGPPDLPRLPEQVESTAYETVVTLVAGLPASGATPGATTGGATGAAPGEPARLDLQVTDGQLRLSLTSDVAPTAAAVQLARDRVEALDGRLTTDGDPPGVLVRLPLDGVDANPSEEGE